MNMMNQWVAICTVDDIPVLGCRVVRRECGGDVALFRNTEDEVFALLDRCPHKGGALSQGIVFGRKVACPLHNWNIELDCGKAVAPDEGCTPNFAVRVQDGQVFLDAAQLASLGVEAPQPAWPKMVRLAT
jgi:nitrite reductase (NADH) small subunit